MPQQEVEELRVVLLHLGGGASLRLGEMRAVRLAVARKGRARRKLPIEEAHHVRLACAGVAASAVPGGGRIRRDQLVRERAERLDLLRRERLVGRLRRRAEVFDEPRAEEARARANGGGRAQEKCSS